MITFKGKPSGETKKYIEKKSGKQLLIVAAISCVLGAAAFISMGFKNPFFFIMAVPSALFFVFSIVLVKKGIVMPVEVQIDGRFIRYRNEKDVTGFFELADVAKVVDMGEFYCFERASGLPAGMFACQKDLVVEGTLEDFEKIFEGKIVKN